MRLTAVIDQYFVLTEPSRTNLTFAFMQTCNDTVLKANIYVRKWAFD